MIWIAIAILGLLILWIVVPAWPTKKEVPTAQSPVLGYDQHGCPIREEHKGTHFDGWA
jgi:hypothetical protein